MIYTIHIKHIIYIYIIYILYYDYHLHPRALSVCSTQGLVGVRFTMTTVRHWPPSASCSNCVSFEFRKGTCDTRRS